MEDHGTTHTSVVDGDGMAVGITSTVNLGWGSQVLDPETGIIFNDQMDDFSMYKTPNAFGLYPSPCECLSVLSSSSVPYPPS